VVGGQRPPQPPPVLVEKLRLSTAVDASDEFSMLLNLEPQRVLYPLEPYPVIREFAAMLRALKPGEQWSGRELSVTPARATRRLTSVGGVMAS
jgi:hypothetical protein